MPGHDPIKYYDDCPVPAHPELINEVPAIYLLLYNNILLSACVKEETNIHPIADGDSFPADNTRANNHQRCDDCILKVATLNVAHSRNPAASQSLLNGEDIKHSLINIAGILKRGDADVVALQEVDGPSAWNGNFDHVELIAGTAGYPWHYRANHA